MIAYYALYFKRCTPILKKRHKPKMSQYCPNITQRVQKSNNQLISSHTDSGYLHALNLFKCILSTSPTRPRTGMQIASYKIKRINKAPGFH